jgi:hypothetical protein
MREIVGEITYDFVMSDDMAFIEGCYRLPGLSWEIVIVSKREIDTPTYHFGQWDSGITGINIYVPQNFRLNAQYLEGFLSTILDVKRWEVVRGPDSIILR